MNLWKVFGSCVLLVLAGALVLKNREVSGLRERARVLGPAGPSDSSKGTKPYGPRRTREESRSSSGSDKLAALLLEGKKDLWSDDGDGTNLFSEIFALNSNGALTPEAIKLLKLTDADVLRLQQAMKSFRSEAVRDLAKRLKPTVNQSDDGSLHQFYYARARRDRGLALFDGLMQEFEPVLGEKHSVALMKGLFRDDLSARLAKLDLEMEVVRPKEGAVMVSYQMRSPKDGRTAQFHTTELAEFEAKFGKLFELPAEK